jgi:hypothetical protein
MTEKKVIRLAIIVFWTFFWGLSVIDKIIPDVSPFWVGKDFYALFIKFFASLGVKNPIVATTALAFISIFEVINFVFYLFSFINFIRSKTEHAEKWFFRAIFSSVLLFGLFSIGDQVFGDRFQLLEHGLLCMVLLSSWIIFKYLSPKESTKFEWGGKKSIRLGLILGTLMTLAVSISILNFSKATYKNVEKPVKGEEVIEGVFKFDFPFLADKLVWEETINHFKEQHPELKITFIYTGPSELNSKKKTHMLLYVFTEPKID